VVLPYYLVLSGKNASMIREYHRFQNPCEWLVTSCEKEKILPTLLTVKARFIAYRVETANRSTLVKQKSYNIRKKEHINCMKHFHPDKITLDNQALELEHRLRWSQTQILAFENEIRKMQFNETFFFYSTINVINEKNSDFFPQMHKPTFGRIVHWILQCVFLLRFSSVYS